MRISLAAILLTTAAAQAQLPPPSFTADGVVAGGGHAPLVPGMGVSLYGANLSGPGCIGKPDPQLKETPSPLRPDQSGVELWVYPKILCGVQVLVGEVPAGLLFVSPHQINFKVPQETPMEGFAPLRVVYQGRSSAAVNMPLGLRAVSLSLDQPAHVNGPVWLRVTPPPFPQFGDLQYPVSARPDDFGCNEVEVRRNGTPLPKIAIRIGQLSVVGPPCGMVSVANYPVTRRNRLPLHLQYRFEQPGVYQVRYTRRTNWIGSNAKILYRSAWTDIEILPAQSFVPPPQPQDPAELLADYLPGLLGIPDDVHLRLIAAHLYDAEELVRRHASSGLGYWPEEQVNRLAGELLHSRGPSDVLVERALSAPGAVDDILPNLQSSHPTLLKGAVLGAARLLAPNPPPLSAAARARVEDALISAAENVLRSGDPQTGNNYASALGTVQDPRARELLWSFVNRNVLIEQSLICITWFKNPADLPRLARLMEGGTPSDTKDRTYASLPYALYHSYGDAALPELESALHKSAYVFVQTNCAEQLILAGRKSGFAFIEQAIEQNHFYSPEMVRFLQDRFPALRTAGQSEIQAFLKSHQ